MSAPLDVGRLAKKKAIREEPAKLRPTDKKLWNRRNPSLGQGGKNPKKMKPATEKFPQSRLGCVSQKGKKEGQVL